MSILGGPLLGETEVEAKKNGNVMAWKTLVLIVVVIVDVVVVVVVDRLVHDRFAQI